MGKRGPKPDPKLMRRNIDILKLRFIRKWTLQKIGDKYGITRERVRQIISENGNNAS